MEVEVWPGNCNGTLHLWDPRSRGLMLNDILEITLEVTCMGGVDFFPLTLMWLAVDEIHFTNS